MDENGVLVRWVRGGVFGLFDLKCGMMWWRGDRLEVLLWGG